MGKKHILIQVLLLLIVPLFIISMQSYQATAQPYQAPSEQQQLTAQSLPIAESPIDFQDILVYRVAYTIGGENWQGYYRFKMHTIYHGIDSKRLVGRWESSVDAVHWDIRQEEINIGNISMSKISFLDTTIIQHRFFSYAWTPESSTSNGSDALVGFIQDEYGLQCVDMEYCGSSASLLLENATHHGGVDLDTWSFKFGVLEKKSIHVINDVTLEEFSFEWNLSYELSYISSFQLNYWGTPAEDEVAYSEGDIFIYEVESGLGVIQNIEKSRLIISEIIVDTYFKQIRYTLEEWNDYTFEWEGETEHTQIIDYSLSGEIFGPSMMSELYLFSPSTIDYGDPALADFIEEKYRWEFCCNPVYAGYELFEYGSTCEKAFYYQATQGWIYNYSYNCLSAQGYRTSISDSYSNPPAHLLFKDTNLLMSESDITPDQPVYYFMNFQEINPTIKIYWHEVYEADYYYVYIDNIMRGISWDTSIELDIGGYGYHVITIVAFQGYKYSKPSDPITVRYIDKNPYDILTDSSFVFICGAVYIIGMVWGMRALNKKRLKQFIR